MQEVAHSILLIWIGGMLAVASLLWLRDCKMIKHFDPNIPDHIMSVAVMLDGLMNSGRKDVRFCLLIWQDHTDDVQGLVSNDTDDKTVIEMLEDAKRRIGITDGRVTAHPHGHA